jgi:phosphohistidine swiveling domain-containing protein
MNYILSQQSRHWTTPVVGGKGSALAQVIQLGFDVPEAFVISTEAYRRFIDQPAASRALTASLHTVRDVTDATAIEKAATTLHKALVSVPILRDVADEISAAYLQLGAGERPDGNPVAVRSSATAEDLPDASFAGQHDSFLNIRGVSRLLEAVRECWASLWTARAIRYRQQRGIQHEQVSMAVIVQKMVRADVSGVLFTINSVSLDHSQMVVNAVYGLGDTLVSGEVTPDQWILDKQTGDVIAGSITVSTETLLKLKEAGVRLEKHFGCPQDVEWALENGRLFILQSRAVTTNIFWRKGAKAQRKDFRNAAALCAFAPLREKSSDIHVLLEDGYWTRAGLSEWLQLPLSPLFSSLVLPKLSAAVDSLLQRRLGLRRRSPSWLVANGYYYIRGDIVFSPGLLLTSFRFFRHMIGASDEWSEEVVPTHTQRIRQLRDFNPQEASARSIIQHFEEVCGTSAQCWAWIVITGTYAKFSEVIFKRLYEHLLKDSNSSYATLLAGFTNKSVEADAALWELAEIARAREELRSIILGARLSDALELLSASEETRDWVQRFQEWLDTYGHPVFELDFLHETISDTPAIPLQVIHNYLENPTPSPASRQRLKLQERHVAEDHFQNVVSKRSLFKGIIWKSFRLAQRYAVIRESRPFYLHLGWPIMRRDVLELGQRLAALGVLEDAKDVFFLTAVELRQWSIELDKARQLAAKSDKEDLSRKGAKAQSTTAFLKDFLCASAPLREKYFQRKREWETQKSLVPPQHLNPNWLARFLSRHLASNSQQERLDVLFGTPASPGKALGSTCLVTSPNDFGKIKQGQILVAPYTTPVWTSLLSLAGGVVTETGGALSHAAIIAREYGIPAVVGVANAVARLPDGTNLEVDGSAGRVCLLAAQRPT